MPIQGSHPVQRPPALFRRIRYQPELESAAFQCLAEFDVDGCRKRLVGLVQRLDLEAAEEGSQVVQLLADILQKVNRRVHRGRERQAAYQWKRVLLIEQFAACRDAA